MGHHLVNPDRRYDRLQERLDRNVTGAPDSPAFRRALEILFSPEDADLASKVPTKPIRVDRLAARLGLETARLDERLADMARRGLVFDLTKNGTRYVSLAPVVIGFFELTFMRAGDDLPRAELARLFEEYFFEGDAAFAKAVFGGDTQIGRSLVRETALGEDATEVLDYERSTRIVETALSAAVSLCACRHHSEHLGKACDAPRRVCLSFGPGAEALVRTGHAERIDEAEALRILHEAQAAGLAQTGDNVKREVGYVAMAIERGKLADLLLEDVESLPMQAIGRLVKLLEAAPPVKAALAIAPLRSAFLSAALPLARLATGGGGASPLT